MRIKSKKFYVIITWHQNTSKFGKFGYHDDFGKGLSWLKALHIKKQWCDEEQSGYFVPFIEKNSNCGDCTIAIYEWSESDFEKYGHKHASDVY